jgi:hypothetical protein
MNGHRVVRGVQIACFAIVCLIVFTFAVRTLWNWLMPALFGLHVITIWQAVGILILSKILFGGFRGGSRGGWRSRRRIIERWEKMTPEQREKFRQSMRGRCGPFDTPAAEPKP